MEYVRITTLVLARIDYQAGVYSALQALGCSIFGLAHWCVPGLIIRLEYIRPFRL